MPLHPQAQTFLNQATQGPGLHEMSVTDSRSMFDAMGALGGEPEPVADVADRTVPGPARDIPIRVYRPSTEANLPVVVYFHAGGYTVGSLESHDTLCRAIANRSGCMLVAVAYRLAPEHKFPAAIDDAWAALTWIAAHASDLGGDGSRLAVAGDSVGGGLATVTAIQARDRGGPRLAFQALIYPDVDFTFSTPSWTTMGQGYFVTVEAACWLRDNYLSSDKEIHDWRASPIFAKDLSGRPPALVICPEFNPARDDMEAYARRLQEAGVPTTFSLYEGMIMGFASMAGTIDAGRAAIDEVGAALRAALRA